MLLGLLHHFIEGPEKRTSLVPPQAISLMRCLGDDRRTWYVWAEMGIRPQTVAYLDGVVVQFLGAKGGLHGESPLLGPVLCRFATIAGLGCLAHGDALIPIQPVPSTTKTIAAARTLRPRRWSPITFIATTDGQGQRAIPVGPARQSRPNSNDA